METIVETDNGTEVVVAPVAEPVENVYHVIYDISNQLNAQVAALNNKFDSGVQFLYVMDDKDPVKTRIAREAFQEYVNEIVCEFHSETESILNAKNIAFRMANAHAQTHK